MLGREPVVRRHDEGVEPGREADAEVVAVGPDTRAEAKTAPMEEKHHGELGRRRTRHVAFGFVQTEGNVELFVENDVFEGNRVVIYDWKREVNVFDRTAVDGTVAKDLENAHAVFNNVRKGTHFCFGWR